MGANLDDRVQNLIDARQQLYLLPETRALRRSSLYLCSPVGYASQPDFINCVLELEFAGSAQHLLAAMQTIENRLGRTRNPSNQNAARIIDLDLLLFGDLQCDDPKMTIPHPRMTQRLFVIEPLMELNPELVIPGLGTLTALLEQGRNLGIFDNQISHRLGAGQIN